MIVLLIRKATMVIEFIILVLSSFPQYWRQIILPGNFSHRHVPMEPIGLPVSLDSIIPSLMYVRSGAYKQALFLDVSTLLASEWQAQTSEPWAPLVYRRTRKTASFATQTG